LRAQSSTSWTRSPTSTAAGEHAGALLVVELGPGGDAVGELTGVGGGTQQFGQPARPAQLCDDAEHATQLAGEGLDSRRRPRVGDQFGVGIGDAALGLVQRPEARPGLDAHDRRRIAGRQRADIGDLGDDGHVATAGVQQDPRLARAAGGGDRRAQLPGAEREGDDRAGEHDRRDRGNRQADGVGGDRGGGGVAHRHAG
jgi:hypothetical protein